MSSHQVRKTEEKLGLIFGRIRSIRIRLNSLAWIMNINAAARRRLEMTV